MNTRSVLAPLLGTVLLTAVLAGCGGIDHEASHADHSTHVMRDGTTMSGAQMQGMNKQGMNKQDVNQDSPMDQAAAQPPSSEAAMICSPEIGDAVQRLFDLPAAPSSTRSWSDQLFGCSYQLADGQLKLSVKDLETAQPGQAYFDGLRTRLSPTTPLSGMTNFGFPAFQSQTGNVVFLKDHKTLQVDASGMPATALPSGYTRAEVAYSLASSVLACWTE